MFLGRPENQISNPAYRVVRYCSIASQTDDDLVFTYFKVGFHIKCTELQSIDCTMENPRS